MYAPMYRHMYTYANRCIYTHTHTTPLSSKCTCTSEFLSVWMDHKSRDNSFYGSVYN